MYYVRIKRINGRKEFYELVNALSIYRDEDGEGVEYFPGDLFTPVMPVAPHLLFKYSDDALAYCLTAGCVMSLSVPMDLTHISA